MDFIKKIYRHPIARFLLPISLMCVIGLIIYSNSFDCTFNFDDVHNIVGNMAIRNITDYRAIWGSYHLRFIGTYSFALNYHFHKLDVFGYHVVNVVIHLLTAIFVWWLVRLIVSSPGVRKSNLAPWKEFVALGCALIFIAHPLQTQAVTYIVQRYASLAALFYLAALSFYMKARLSKHNGAVALLFFLSVLSALLGMFTKETVFTLPFAIFLFEAGFIRNTTPFMILRERKLAGLFTVLAMMTLILPVLVFLKRGTLFWSSVSQRAQDPLLTNGTYLISQFRVIVRYIRLLFFPYGQNLDHDIAASTSIFYPPTLISFIFIATIIAFAVWIYRKNRFVSVGILWIFLTLSVESTIIPLGNIMFEHRLYLPMFGFGMICMGSLQYVAKEKYAIPATALLVLLISTYSGLTYQRNKVWKDDYTLWRDAALKSPNKERPHNNFGNALKQRGEIDEAIKEYEIALRIHPEFAEAYNNLGNALVLQGKNDAATAHFQHAIALDPNFSKAYNNLGNVLKQEGNIAEAIENFRTALRLNPNYPNACINLGVTLNETGNYEEAVTLFEKALTIESASFEALSGLAAALDSQGKKDLATRVYQRALAINPLHASTHFNLGNMYYRQGNYRESIQEFESVLSSNPDLPDLHKNFGLSYSRLGEFDQAVEHLKIAAQSSDDSEITFLLGVILRQQNKLTEAIDYFQRTLQLNASHQKAHIELAYCYEALGRPDESKFHSNEAKKLQK